MKTEGYIKILKDGNKWEINKAIDYFGDLFYYDKVISDKDYIDLVIVITDKIQVDSTSEESFELLGILNSSFYTDKTDNFISTETFQKAINYIAEKKNRFFYQILEPLKSNENFILILKPYFDELDNISN